MSVSIRQLTAADIKVIVASFAAHDWPKPAATFISYLSEQEAGERLIWVAYDRDEFAGYITLKWQSSYPSFQNQHIPEIMDFNVLPPFQGKGIGSALLKTAENEAQKKSRAVGLGVGLYDGYGRAQKLYINKGYRPDGLGITYNHKRVQYGKNVPLDDDLILWFTKDLRQ